LERAKKIKAFKLQDSKRDTIIEKIVENVEKGSRIITDERRAYYWLYSLLNHDVVNHSNGEYKKSNDTHTNSIEGFWATLKRGIYGVYHHISSQHNQNYINEFCFRYNERDNNKSFDKLIKQCVFVK